MRVEYKDLTVTKECCYQQQLTDLMPGKYILRVVHKAERVLQRPRSMFLTYSIPGASALLVKDLLKIKDISHQFGAFSYISGGRKFGGYIVQEAVIEFDEKITNLNLEIRTFLLDKQIILDAFQIYNSTIPNNVLFGDDPLNLFFKTTGIDSSVPTELKEISFQKISKHTSTLFNINKDTDKRIVIKDIERGKYSLKIRHNSKIVFDRPKSLFISFSLFEKSSSYVKEVLGLKDVSLQYGAFDYIGGGKLDEAGYEQEIILNVIEPITTLDVFLKSFLSENILIENWILEKLPEEDKIYTSKSVVTRPYPQYWISHVTEEDNFIFEEKLVDFPESKLSTSDTDVNTCIIPIFDTDTLTVRINLAAEENHHLDKQAILTINYLDINNNSLESKINSPYSPKLKKYYHYLSVDPEYNNNLHLPLPKDVVTVELAVQLWDNQSDILFDGKIQVAQHKLGVSIIVPSYKGEDTILRCLESLGSQTLPFSMYEVIIALNGERDSTREKIEEYQKKCPNLDITLLELNKAGASYARNEALKKAKFSYATFVDDDDFIDKSYLFYLYEKASWNTITLTGVNDVLDETGRLLESSILNQLKKASKKDIITYQDVTSLLTMNACKMAPIHMVKSVVYNEALKSGEDVVYWSKILSLFIPLLELSNNFERAVYYRVITNNSVSRQEESYDFNVKQRLDVISDLLIMLRYCENEGALKSNISFIQSKINAQALFIKRYLENHEDDYETFQKETNDRQLSNKFINSINEHFTKRLVISYCFAPYADTSAVVMSKRINKMTHPVDVISNSMNNVRTKDESLHQIASFNIGKHVELNAPQSFSNSDAIVKFSEMVVQEVGKIISKRSMYKEIYSRAMWPASHFAAALIKKKFSHVKWIAEFSDPLLKGVTGEDRYSELSMEWLKKHELIEIENKDEFNDNIFYWCEKLVYDHADEIIFTNENQKEYMVSYADVDSLIIENKSKITPQPTLEKQYYNISNLKLNKETGNIYVGYFGSFYINRGFDSFFEAWSNLETELKGKIRLYVYTQQDRNEVLNKASADIRDYIVIVPYVEYFDFLSLSKQFDILLVMDTKTEGIKQKNPYLPSKISDYLGSENNILAFVEDGSPMNELDSKNLYKVGLNSFNEISRFMKGYLTK